MDKKTNTEFDINVLIKALEEALSIFIEKESSLISDLTHIEVSRMQKDELHNALLSLNTDTLLSAIDLESSLSVQHLMQSIEGNGTSVPETILTRLQAVDATLDETIYEVRKSYGATRGLLLNIIGAIDISEETFVTQVKECLTNCDKFGNDYQLFLPSIYQYAAMSVEPLNTADAKLAKTLLSNLAQIKSLSGCVRDLIVKRTGKDKAEYLKDCSEKLQALSQSIQSQSTTQWSEALKV